MEVGDHGMNVRDGYVCIDSKLRLGMLNYKNDRAGDDGTYIEDVKNPVEIRSPGRYSSGVVFCR